MGKFIPMVKVENGYIPDFENRFFSEDFPYGVALLKGFAIIADVPTPALDKLLYWYQAIANKEYFTKDNQLGKDISETSAPQKFGFSNADEIIKFYKEG